MTPKASRHLYLIRHGQYNMNAPNDHGRDLTKLGMWQGFPFSDLGMSWMFNVFQGGTKRISLGNAWKSSTFSMMPSSTPLWRELEKRQRLLLSIYPVCQSRSVTCSKKALLVLLSPLLDIGSQKNMWVLFAWVRNCIQGREELILQLSTVISPVSGSVTTCPQLLVWTKRLFHWQNLGVTWSWHNDTLKFALYAISHKTMICANMFKSSSRASIWSGNLVLSFHIWWPCSPLLLNCNAHLLVLILSWVLILWILFLCFPVNSPSSQFPTQVWKVSSGLIWKKKKLLGP